MIDYALVESSEYQEALATQDDLLSLGSAPYVARSGAQESTLADAVALTSFLEERGRKGVDVSRYKGLGEMNADELWETTMDPDARLMKQVTLDDAAQADEIFSILMGEDVEQRRSFIQRNAKDVRFLDI